MEDPKILLRQFKNFLESVNPTSWAEIDIILTDIQGASPETQPLDDAEFNARIKTGVAFITYDFGIDGVSIEIAKYAAGMQNIFNSGDYKIPLHFIGGNFFDKADNVLEPEWRRFRIPGFDGWSKWYDGKWFSKLYYEEMPEDSKVSHQVAKEIWREAKDFAYTIGEYLVNNNINLMIPVNIPTNPGNLAAELAIVMVSEALGTMIISSNHDFYWEGGKPASEREPGEEGVRDHFFKNIDNYPFFHLFKRVYPWNGRRWLQVNINTPQSEALINKFGFPKGRVFELGTSLSDKFFEDYGKQEIKSVRLRMAHILSDGFPVINPTPVAEHRANLPDWMQNQKPLVCGFSAGLKLDPTTEKTLYCLQPTRIIGRKRIPMDLQILESLFHHQPFAEAFANDPDYQLVLHITGPIPIEHQADLDEVLQAYQHLCGSVDPQVANRIFLAFSVGTENHACFKEKGFEPLCIEEIYRLANVILFPSETEGRGLPIVESSACGIPIICSRYHPVSVFEEVVGEHLTPPERIEYIEFPEDGCYPNELLDKFTALLLKPEEFDAMKKHNKKAVHDRYSMAMIQNKFKRFFATLQKIG